MRSLEVLVPLVFAASSRSLLAGESTISAKTMLAKAGIQPGPTLCVHLGCGDGKLAAALAKEGEFLVHGLALDRAEVDKARQNIRAQGLYGQASVELLKGKLLPYADNLVDILVVAN